MPTALGEAEIDPSSPESPRKVWTVCAALAAYGVLGPDQLRKLDLLAGEPIQRLSKQRPHSHTLLCLIDWLHQVFGRQYVQHETPIDVSPMENDTNEPEPDASSPSGPGRPTCAASPNPKTSTWVMEVSDATFRLDRP